MSRQLHIVLRRMVTRLRPARPDNLILSGRNENFHPTKMPLSNAGLYQDLGDTDADMGDPGLDLESHTFESIMQQDEAPYTSPRTPPQSSCQQLLGVPSSFGGYYKEPAGVPARAKHIHSSSASIAPPTSSPEENTNPSLESLNLPSKDLLIHIWWRAFEKLQSDDLDHYIEL
jgi:hypothetical protein